MTFCASWNPSEKPDAWDKMVKIQEGKDGGRTMPQHGRLERGLSYWVPVKENGKSKGCRFGWTEASGLFPLPNSPKFYKLLCHAVSPSVHKFTASCSPRYEAPSCRFPQLRYSMDDNSLRDSSLESHQATNTPPPCLRLRAYIELLWTSCPRFLVVTSHNLPFNRQDVLPVSYARTGQQPAQRIPCPAIPLIAFIHEPSALPLLRLSSQPCWCSTSFSAAPHQRVIVGMSVQLAVRMHSGKAMLCMRS